MNSQHIPVNRGKMDQLKRANSKGKLFQTLPYSTTDDTEFLPNLSQYRKRSFNNLFSDPPLSLGRNAENEITDILADRRSWHLSNDRAIVYYAKGDYQQSLQLHVKNLRNVEDSKRILIAETYRNMGICFLALQKYQDAKKLFWKYFFIADELKSNFLISSACHYLLELYDYELTDHLSKSSISLEKVYEDIEALKKKREKANLSLKGINISDNRFRAPFERAINVHERVLENGLIDKILIAHNHLAIADLYINLRDYAEAMKHLIKAEPYAKDNVEKLRMIQLKKFQCCFDNNQYRKAITIMKQYRNSSSENLILVHLANIKLVDAARKLQNKFFLIKFAKSYMNTSKTVEDNIGFKISKDILLIYDIKDSDRKQNASKETDTAIDLSRKKKNLEGVNNIMWNKNNDEAIKNFADFKLKNAKDLHLINILIADNNRNMKKERDLSILNIAICYNNDHEDYEAIQYCKQLITNNNNKNKAYQLTACYFIIDSYEKLLFKERSKHYNINTFTAQNYKSLIQTYTAKMKKLDPRKKKLMKVLAKNINIHKNALNKVDNKHKKHNLIILGNLYFATKQYDLAIEKFEGALKLMKNETNKQLKCELLLLLFKCSRARTNDNNKDGDTFKYLMNYFECGKNGNNLTAKCFAYETVIDYVQKDKELLQKYLNEYRRSINCEKGTLSWESIQIYLPDEIRKQDFKAKSLEDLTKQKFDGKNQNNRFGGRVERYKTQARNNRTTSVERGF